MRTFYIFQINKELAILTKDCPINLYKTMEQIYYLNPKDAKEAYKIFASLAEELNKKEINLKLFEIYRHNQGYTKFNNRHMLCNYYTDESTELTVNNIHLIIKSSMQNPCFLNDLKETKNLFVCDFINKDYFWLDQILV